MSDEDLLSFGDPLLLPAPRPPDDGPRRSLMLVTAGLGLSGVALGSLFGGMALSRWDDVKEAAKNGGCRDAGAYTGCSPSVGKMEVEASSFATISTFCFLAGGLAIAGTTLLWVTGPPTGFLPRPPAQTARVQVAPAIGPGTGGATLRGTF